MTLTKVAAEWIYSLPSVTFAERSLKILLHYLYTGKISLFDLYTGKISLLDPLSLLPLLDSLQVTTNSSSHSGEDSRAVVLKLRGLLRPSPNTDIYIIIDNSSKITVMK